MAADRITNRALWIGRGDSSPLGSFNETAFMQASDFDGCKLADLLTEFELVRRSNLLLFKHFPEDAWMRVGTVKNHPMTVRALAYAIGGHAKHHLDILKQRLNKAAPA